jgi:gliding motility-associated-like protein
LYKSSLAKTYTVEKTIQFAINAQIGLSSKPYIVSSPTLSSEAKFLTYQLAGQVSSEIVDLNINVLMPYGTDLSHLKATFTSSHLALVKVNDVLQQSGITENNFNQNVDYQLYAADETTTSTYSVTVLYANAMPEDIFLSNNKIYENALLNDTIGSFSAQDPNAEDVHIFQFVSGEGDTDNASFIIEDNLLILNTKLDFETKSTYSIRVQVDDKNGGVFEKSFTVEILDSPEIFEATNVFSPNNDGFNEFWEIENSYQFRNCKFYIFNNIGEIVYETLGYNNDWNGTKNGKELPIGTYFYVIKCSECATCTYSGFISLVR